MKQAYMLRTYKACNSMVDFSNNKLLGNVTLLMVTPNIT